MVRLAQVVYAANGGGADELQTLGLVDPNPGVARLLPLPTVMATPPTIAAPQRTASTIANAQVVAWNDPRLRVYGNTLIQAGTTSPDRDYGKAGNNPASAFFVEFWFDGTEFEVAVKGTGNGARLRLWVDGQPATTDYQGGTDNGVPADGGRWYLKYAFPDAQPRKITLDCYGFVFLYGLFIGPTDTVWPDATPLGPRVVVLGDSYTEAGSAIVTSKGFPYVAGRAVGWRDVWASGSGGTGYLNPGTGGRTTFRGRVQGNVIAPQPDIVIVAGGLNDTSYSASAVGDEAALLFADIRDALPEARLIVLSPFWPRETPPQSAIELRDVLHQRATDVDALFVDTLGGPEPWSGNTADYTRKGWITGTGRINAPTGSGNADRYISSDSTHPTPEGHRYLGLRLAQRIADAISAGAFA